jgi:hypothetical protein
MADRNEVLRNYSSLVSRLWEDVELLNHLQAEPRKILSRFGFNIPENAQIRLIIRDLNTDGSPETQVKMLAQAEATGIYNIIIPMKPADVKIEDIPLKEEVLELMAGGAGCCPCSTCCCPCCGDDAQVTS